MAVQLGRIPNIFNTRGPSSLTRGVPLHNAGTFVQEARYGREWDSRGIWALEHRYHPVIEGGIVLPQSSFLMTQDQNL